MTEDHDRALRVVERLGEIQDAIRRVCHAAEVQTRVSRVMHANDESQTAEQVKTLAAIATVREYFLGGAK